MSSDCLFNNVVPTFISSGFKFQTPSTGSQFGIPATSSTDFGRRCDSLHFELIFSTTTIPGRRNLELHISDKNDPFFLWSCSLSEEDFFILKREQNLLVDYSRFPYKLLELLQQCLAHSREDRPLFAITLYVDDSSSQLKSSTLTITETTSFRQINHLTLRMVPANEQVMRKHVSDVMRQYKDEINVLRNQGNRPVFPSTDPYMSAPSSQTTRPPTLSNDERIRFLESQNLQLCNQKASLESELTDLKQRYMAVQEELNQRGRLVNPYHAFPSRPLDQSPPYMTSNSQQLQSEVNKANEIIRKLQDEVKSLRNRARSAETSLRQLERVSKETHTSYDGMRNELNDARNQIAEKTKTLAEVQADRDRLVVELEETRKLVDANEKVIEWLHQQINEDSITRMLSKQKPIGDQPIFFKGISPDIWKQTKERSSPSTPDTF